MTPQCRRRHRTRLRTPGGESGQHLFSVAGPRALFSFLPREAEVRTQLTTPRLRSRPLPKHSHALSFGLSTPRSPIRPADVLPRDADPGGDLERALGTRDTRERATQKRRFRFAPHRSQRGAALDRLPVHPSAGASELRRRRVRRLELRQLAERPVAVSPWYTFSRFRPLFASTRLLVALWCAAQRQDSHTMTLWVCP